MNKIQMVEFLSQHIDRKQIKIKHKRIVGVVIDSICTLKPELTGLSFLFNLHLTSSEMKNDEEISKLNQVIELIKELDEKQIDNDDLTNQLKEEIEEKLRIISNHKLKIGVHIKEQDESRIRNVYSKGGDIGILVEKGKKTDIEGVYVDFSKH